MRSFCVADLNVRGDLLAKQQYRYDQLEQLPGASDLITTFATLLWRTPEELEVTLSKAGSASRGVSARWRSSSETSGILTLRGGDEGDLATLSLLASGISADADRLTFAAFQQRLLRELHGTENEPAFALMDLTERPIIATINFRSPPDDMDRLMVALADRCFAAAYFRTKDLA